jgi:hypothetical protein
MVWAKYRDAWLAKQAAAGSVAAKTVIVAQEQHAFISSAMATHDQKRAYLLSISPMAQHLYDLAPEKRDRFDELSVKTKAEIWATYQTGYLASVGTQAATELLAHKIAEAKRLAARIPWTQMEIDAVYPDSNSLTMARLRKEGKFAESRLPGFYAQPEVKAARAAFFANPDRANYFNYFHLLGAAKLTNGQSLSNPLNGVYPAVHGLTQFDPEADAMVGKWQAIHDPAAQKDLTWHGLVIGAGALALAAVAPMVASTTTVGVGGVQGVTPLGFGVGGEMTTAAGLTSVESLAASAMAPVVTNIPLSVGDIVQKIPTKAPVSDAGYMTEVSKELALEVAEPGILDTALKTVKTAGAVVATTAGIAKQVGAFKKEAPAPKKDTQSREGGNKGIITMLLAAGAYLIFS